MIDLHVHVLPAVDDGPARVEDAIALARAVVAAGTTTVVATPHVDHRYGVDPRRVGAAVRRLAERLRGEGVALDVRPGAEVSLVRCGELDRDELAAASLGGAGWVLLESPHAPAGALLEPAVLRLQALDFRVLLAHPERAPDFLDAPRSLARLVELGAACSITAGSLIGRFGHAPRDLALAMLEDGLVHNVASDAHDDRGRSPALRPGLEAAERRARGVGELAAWLTEDVPAAVLAGESLPAPPGVRVRRRVRDRLRLRAR
jgi:protein-tyrosine phosphatase